MYINVLIDRPVKGADNGFTYEVPPSWEGQIKAGIRVSVPFGRQYLVGFVMDRVDELPDDLAPSKVKKIKAIIDSEPVLSPELIKVGDWMSARYFSRLASIYQAMLPAGIKTESSKKVICQLAADQILDLDLDDSEQELLNHLAFCRIAREGQILDKYPDSWDTILDLAKAGHIQIVEEHKKQAQTQYQQQLIWVNSDIDDYSSEEDLAKVFGRAKRQLDIAKFLLANKYTLAHNQSIAINELEDRLGAKTSLRSVLKTMAARGYVRLLQVERRRIPNQELSGDNFVRPTLTSDQEAAYESIINSYRDQEDQTFLLHGVTGSGKTEVYLQAIDAVIADDKEAIVLVPEISLTPQMVERFKLWFGDRVAVLHSRLSIGERHDEWNRIRYGEAKVVVGARSAIFAPFSNLGLIVIDEEHEGSYKQEENPKYDAREVAVYRSKWHKCPIVLGSATPSIESKYMAGRGRYHELRLDRRVNEQIMPEMTVIDMRKEMSRPDHHILSQALVREIGVNLARGQQTILFINRRGHSSFVICRECGHVAFCPHCSIGLTYHKRKDSLVCHYCGHEEKNYKKCEVCQSEEINLFGLGTEKVEEEVRKFYPEARILRMDMDTTARKGQHQKIINSLAKGQADILIGTQMVAKGLDFPKVTLVGVISADTGLYIPDFRSAEKTFQLITQVGGRAGRHQEAGRVIVQTYNPSHYSIQYAVNYRYNEFYEREIRARQELGYPPFSRLIFIIVSHGSEQIVRNFSSLLARRIREKNQEENPLYILGPTPAVLARIKNSYRYSLIIKYASWQETNTLIRQVLDDLEEEIQKNKIVVDIDVNPQTLL